jgi:circadian clock protein KaiB
MSKFELRLYVAGQTSRSEQAIANLYRTCEDVLDACDIRIIDVLEQPMMAEEKRILATPTLVKSVPPPARRIIGDLSDVRQVARMLGLPAGEGTVKERGEGPHGC